MIGQSVTELARARLRSRLQRQLIVATRQTERADELPSEHQPLQRREPEHHDHAEQADEVPVWDALTRRSVSLCRQDRARWDACMDRADSLEAQGHCGHVALRQALDEAGG